MDTPQTKRLRDKETSFCLLSQREITLAEEIVLSLYMKPFSKDVFPRETNPSGHIKFIQRQCNVMTLHQC